MIQYPDINPIAFHIGSLKVRWYGMMYFFGFIAALLLGFWRVRKPYYNFTKEQLVDMLIVGVFGIVLGARLGFELFWNFTSFIHNPLQFFNFLQGGEAFHGGFLGAMFVLWLYSFKSKCSIWDLTDFWVPFAPIALGLGRIGNFINGEIWGRVSDVPWAMVFPGAGRLPRHPSQIYEALTEGVLLFIILFWFSSRQRPRFATSAMFLLFYGLFRFAMEFFRQPYVLVWHWLTEGMVLTIPMIIWGAAGLVYIYGFRERRKQQSPSQSELATSFVTDIM